MMHIVLLSLAGCVLLITQAICRRQRSQHSLDHISTHSFADGNSSNQRYLTNLRYLLESGYRRYNKAEKAFKITIPIGGYAVKYRVVLPKSHIEEIKHLPQQKGNVDTVNLMEFFIPTITYVTNALLVDKSLSSDPTWLKETADFAVSRYGAADDVRRWPLYLASIVAPMIPSVRRLRRQREHVMERLRPLYNELKAAGELDAHDKKSRQKGALGYD